MRTQYCREHIDKAAVECGLDSVTVFEVKQVAEFCLEHPEFNKCSTKAVITIVRVREPDVRARVIDDAKEMLTHHKKLTEKQVKQIVCEQANAIEVGGACEICGKRFTTIDKPQKDHDHKTGAQRGLLCMHCNTAIGKFNDDPELLLRAIQYLRKYQ